MICMKNVEILNLEEHRLPPISLRCFLFQYPSAGQGGRVSPPGPGRPLRGLQPDPGAVPGPPDLRLLRGHRLLHRRV